MSVEVGVRSLPLLSVEDLVVRYSSSGGMVHAVNGISLELSRAETLGLVGESGCGKTATGLAVMRLLPEPAGRVTGGRILLAGADLLRLSDREMRAIRGRDVAMIFQDPMTSLNPVFTVGDQLGETIRAHRSTGRREARERAVSLLDMVGIPEPAGRLKDYPHQFSGGMRQRVMIAMALALEPKLIIADEPTTALDVTIQAQVLALLQQLAADHGTAMLLISHDLGVVAGITQRVAVMYAGYIVETGATVDLFETPAHPYTVGLLHSMTRLDQPLDKPLVPIEGAPPDLRRLESGCPFAPRCQWRIARCERENPPLTATVTDGGSEVPHLCACWNPPSREEADAGLPLRLGILAGDNTPVLRGSN
jgi:oligopeptide/dipeptide ABC transporter ATP-binding protein